MNSNKGLPYSAKKIKESPRTHHPLPLLFSTPPQPHHHRHPQTQIPIRQNNPLGNHIAKRQPTKNIHKNDFYTCIFKHNAEGLFYSVGSCAAAHVEEVGA